MLKTLIISFMLIMTTAFAGTRSDTDANADHNIITPTTETMNQGEMTFNSYELIFAGLSYGVTDNFQLTFTTMLPITEEIPFIGLLTGKYKLMDDGKSAFSIQPGALIINENDVTVGTINLTFIFDLILNENNVLTFSSASNMPFAESETMDGFITTFTVAINSKVSEHVKLIGELTAMGAYIDGEFRMADNAALLNYGVRFFNKDLAAMLSFIKPIGEGDSGLLMGLPYVTFSAKF